MATQTYEWIIRAQTVGFAQAAQEVLRGTTQINRALSDMESRSVNLRPSAFANVPEKSRPGTVDQSVLRAEARAYDEVARAAVRLRDAELARVEAVRRTRGVFAKDYIKDPVARERLDSRTLAALDVASQRHQEAKAAADRAKAEADSRRAMFGPTVAQSMFNDRGGIAYPGKGDLFNNQIQAAIGRAQQETLAAAREEASLRKQRNASIRRDLTEGIKEAGERRRQAAADAEGARQMALYNAHQAVPYARPDLSTRVGVAQDFVNRASRALAQAEQARADLIAKGNPTAQQLIASDRALEAANSTLTRARLAEARAASHVSHSNSLLGRTRDQFWTGFRGQSEMPYAQQIGQAFKFSVFYGTAYKLLTALTTTLTATLQEGIQFQSAMTELKIASGQSADAANEMAESLGANATAAGLAPSVGVTLGARSLGLFGATSAAGASQAEQQRVMDISSRVVSRMALGSKTTPEELLTQVAAVANAFGGGAAGQIRAYDLDAYLSRQFGIGQGMTVQAVAESGTVGQAAGFDQEQVSAIAAYLQGRTGQTPSAVAGWMAQIFSRGGEGSLVALGQKYGIDPNAQLSVQIAELAQVYKNASKTEQAEIAAGFGRGKVQNAAVVLLDGLDTVMKTAEKSRTESKGEGDRISDLRMADIGGQIKLTVSTLQTFASELGRSGVLEVLGAGILAFRELVEAATGVLRAWNEIPGVMKAAIAAVLAYTMALRAGAGAGVAGALLGIRGSGGLVGIGPGRAGGPPAAAGALAGAGPWIAAAAGLYALGELTNSSKALKAAEESATNLLNSTIEGDITPDSLRARSAELTQRATISREAADGSWINNVVPLLRNQAADLESDASTMEMEAVRLDRAAKILENAAADAAAGVVAPVITGFDEESLTQSFDAIARAGGSAETQMRELAAAINGTADAAGKIPENRPDVFAAANGEPLVNLLSENITGITGDKMSRRSVVDALSGYNSTPEAALQIALRGAGITDITQLDTKSATEAAEALVAQTEGTADYVGTEEYNRAVAAVSAWLLSQTTNARDLVDAARELTPEEAVANIAKIMTGTEAVAGTLQETDFKGAIANQRRAIRLIKETISQVPGGATAGMTEQLDVARRNLAQAEFAELENMRRAAQRNAKSRAEVARIGRRFLRREIRAAVRGGNTDLLAEIIGQAGDGAVAIARAVMRETLESVRAAQQAFRAMVAARNAIAGALAGINPMLAAASAAMPQTGGYGKRINEIKDMINSLGWMQTSGPGGNVYQLGSDLPDYEKLEGKDKKTKEQREAEREAARQEMLDLQSNLYLLSIDMRNPLAMAVAAVKDARRRLQSDIASGQDAGTIAASRVALRQAQIEQQETARQEMLELQNNLYLLSIDLTDPLAQATAGVMDARRRLQSDMANGATPSAVAADRVALKQAQAEREATAFQQRLDAVTTAEELGRISHRKYLSYLENERRRLDGIKNRTFQQQEQLDQIDRLMKSAADSMQGMWNFGDIKLPTPYQVRRQVEQMRLDRSTQLDATSRQVASQSTIYIDGADTGKVRQIINETLSKSNATVTNRPRRR